MKELSNNEVQLDKSMILYKRTIVDKVLYQEMSDGTSLFISDIAVLKGVNTDEASPALVEALSMRMEMRPATPTPKMSDDQILDTMKARNVQDPTELSRYVDALKHDVANGMKQQDYDDALNRAKEQVNETVVPEIKME